MEPKHTYVCMQHACGNRENLDIIHSKPVVGHSGVLGRRSRDGAAESADGFTNAQSARPYNMPTILTVLEQTEPGDLHKLEIRD